MPEVGITDTETNPSASVGYGGGKRDFTNTETTPTYLGGGGGGWRVFTETEKNPTYKLPKDTQTMGRTKGFDFRGKGFRI
ncbi:unnamed protein product [marine sediment metagenome]|uniref:Uncharacterized protein n=1 Tax=marine sediment metagenome TaxID=412755 RepID=X1RXF7_9ZZZZ